MAYKNGTLAGREVDSSNLGSLSSLPQQSREELSGASLRRVMDVQKARRSRTQCLGPDLFSDPAWDILLELFEAELSQRRMPISALGIESGVPQTTTLRWLAVLEGRGLIARHPDRLDGRRVFISLSEAGLAAMTKLFNSIPRSENLL